MNREVYQQDLNCQGEYEAWLKSEEQKENIQICKTIGCSGMTSNCPGDSNCSIIRKIRS